MARKVPEGLLALNDRVGGKRIRCNHKTLVPNNKGYAEVMMVGDVHLGSPQCDEERFLRQLQYCLDNHVYVQLMGDLLESANRHSVGGGVYEQLENTQSQYERMVEMLRPLAEAGLILGSHTGNHCDRVYNQTGVNIMKALCRELSIPYLGGACWSYWRVGSQGYRIYTLHGASGARLHHTKMKAILDISYTFEDADVIAQGHVHDCADFWQTVQFYDARRKMVCERKKLLLITGHYLSYDGSYAQQKGMSIGKMGSPKVKFFADKKDLHISW
jgi:hypothetical protein